MFQSRNLNAENFPTKLKKTAPVFLTQLPSPSFSGQIYQVYAQLLCWPLLMTSDEMTTTCWESFWGSNPGLTYVRWAH